ncbi:MAG: hypothetical protein NC928_04025 [Candidatus Omnitrophica bacterium]|nr:hypothetical protein [Candidatus Omnitrophota bacterium]
MKRVTFLLFLIFYIFCISSLEAKSIVRQGEPIISFDKLYIPESIKQGEFFKISAEMKITKNIWEDMGVFLHICRPEDNKILINNDFVPNIPTTQWTVGEIIRVGPINSYIPQDLPPGLYNVCMGLFSTKVTAEEGVLYIREPYTNKEIKDFVVGKIKVESSLPQPVPKKEDLLISSFETIVDLKKWQAVNCFIEQNSENVAEGSYSAKVTYLKGKGCCPSVLLESFFRYSDPRYSDWTEYDILQFQIYGAKDAEGHTYLKYPVYLQVKDKSERRFQWPIATTQEKDNPVKFILSNIGKEVDLSDIGNLSFFVSGTPAEEDWTIYLDNIRLISLGLERIREPFVRFEGLKISKDRIKPGEEIEITASFSISHEFSEDYNLYIHIYRTLDKVGWINADIFPSPPTTQWKKAEIITQGPFSIYIPPDTPPGKYSIEIGLFLARQVSVDTNYIKYHRGKDGVYYIQQPSYPIDYFKQPYVNYEEYGDWVVGSFEVITP